MCSLHQWARYTYTFIHSTFRLKTAARCYWSFIGLPLADERLIIIIPLNISREFYIKAYLMFHKRPWDINASRGYNENVKLGELKKEKRGVSWNDKAIFNENSSDFFDPEIVTKVRKQNSMRRLIDYFLKRLLVKLLLYPTTFLIYINLW